jgi:ATP-dependent helicase/nuclease subunit B
LILSKHPSAKEQSIYIDQLVNDKLLQGRIAEILFIVPTRRKIRDLTRELISLTLNKSAGGLKIETIGSFAEKLLEDIEGEINTINEEAAVLLLNHSFKKTKLNYFSQYKEQIPFGTLERVKNVVSEYKRHGITPLRLKDESAKLSGGEQLKAIDIANVYAVYQKSLEENNFKEIGDVYASVNNLDKEKFNASFSSVYPDTKLILVNGFDEFTLPEVELINSASGAVNDELYIILDYYKYNPLVFSHLNACHDRFIEKGFKDVKDISKSSQIKFIDRVREKLSLKVEEKKETTFEKSITQIIGRNREEEIEFIAKEIKKLISSDEVEPEKICVVFNLIGKYSPIIRDRFKVYGIPYNLTDRFTLSTSNPVKAVISFLEISENDFYYKNIFRAFSSGLFNTLMIDISDLLKTSVELKIVSGYNNWMSRIGDAIATRSSADIETDKDYKRIEQYRRVKDDLEKINSNLKEFSARLTADEFRKNISSLIFSLNLPEKLLDAHSEESENNIIAFNNFIRIVDEIANLIKLEYGEDDKHSLKFYLNQLRTTAAFTRYNIPEKPGFGVQITTLNEIRGLSFDYLFISGLNDGDFPTRYTPEIFFSGTFAKEEYRHQVEQRYLFYQALCTWNKKLYLTYPQFDDKRELVQSSFLQDFNSLFAMKTLTSVDFGNKIYSKEELLEMFGKLSSEQRKKIKISQEADIDLEKLQSEIEIEGKRNEDPFGESDYSGFISKISDEEIGVRLQKISKGEFSATQLENYAKCPYKYFVENVLQLETITEPVEELEAFEYGSLIHSILYEFYSKLKEKGIVLFNCSDDDFKITEELLFKIAEKRFDELNLSSDLSFYEREKLLGIRGNKKQSILYKFLNDERQNDGGYVPSFFEIGFGKVKEEKNSGKLREGVKAGKIRLKGKIDRIDINKDEETLKVIDYKLGGTKPTSEDLKSGISLQLPLYLFAAKELIKKEFDKEYKPADAQIFSLKYNEKDFGKKSIKIKPYKVKKENNNDEINTAEEMIKICLDAVNKFAEDISKGIFHLSQLKNRETKVCRFCDFKKICRIQEVA